MCEQQTQEPGGSPRASSIAAAFEPRTRSGRRISRLRLPHELTDQSTVTLLSMLSADLGPQGEALLKRLARDAPHHLAVAVETPGGAAALAEYSYELLADLTEAYYIDQTPMGQGIYDDGVRRHQAHVGQALAAWEYGPFAVLLARDFHAGARVVNRILNYAVRCRINPNLVGDDERAADLSEDVIEQVGLRAELVPGESAVMLGDDEVWSWFRGTSRAPYPCLSALFAVERQSDLLAASGVELCQIRRDLLADCENVAMPAVLLDLFTRNIEQAGDLIEPFLADPEIWEADITQRAAQQAYGIRSSYSVTNSERRTWMLQDTALFLALHADAEKAERLRAIRRHLVEDVANAIEAAKRDLGADWTAESQRAADEYAALVDTRTGALDADRLNFERAEVGIKVSAEPSAETEELLIPRQAEQAKANQLLYLHNRYYVAHNLRHGDQAPYTPEEVAADLDTACALVSDRPNQWPVEPWDVAAQIAVTTLYEHIVAAMQLPPETLRTASEVLLDIVEGARPPTPYEDLYQIGEWLADRSAARGLPLMKLPKAAGRTTDATEDITIVERVTTGCARLAAEAPFETRLFLARALDPFWQTPCTTGACAHTWAFALIHMMLEGCVLGSYSHTTGRRMPRPLTTSIEIHIRNAQPDEIDVNQLDPAIRACAFAAASSTCVSQEARALLDVLLDAHRRALLKESGYDHRGELALGAARAILRIAHAGDCQPLHHHIEELSGDDELLERALVGLAAAAEESPWGSSTACRLWPEVITQITGIKRLHVLRNPRLFDYEPLAAALPRKTLDAEFFHRELGQPPREWRDVHEWRSAIEEWLVPAAGQPQCVAALIHVLRTLPVTDQAEIGLPWVADLVFARPSAMVPRPYALPEWLISIHTTTDELGTGSLWQRVVDDLVVSGCSQLAGYAD